MIKKSVVRFAEPELKKELEELLKGTDDEKQLNKFINRALDDLEENAFCGI